MATFLNWDFENIWAIGETQTYPYLRKYLAADLNRDNRVDMNDLLILSEQWLNIFPVSIQ